MKITHVDTTEEMVLNPKYKGLRVARIEIWTDREGQHYPYEVGRIEVFEDDELFIPGPDDRNYVVTPLFKPLHFRVY